MNKVRITSYVNAYAKALGLKNVIRNILNKLMIEIISKYEKAGSFISINTDDSKGYFIKPIDGKYSIEDFFLNRMMKNILSVDIIDQNNINEFDVNLKGCYDPSVKGIFLNFIKMIKGYEKYKKYLREDFDNARKKAFEKVVEHEFLHGLQTKFDGFLDYNYKSIYRKIYDEISKLDDTKGRLNSFDNCFKEYSRDNYLFTGTHYSSVALKKGIKTYRNIEGFDYLNEILNESESLEISQSNTGLYRTYESGYYYPIRNIESSNYGITNYGFLIKEILGMHNAFAMMYLNPSYGFNIINKEYGDIFKKHYGVDKDAMEILINAICEIRKNDYVEDHIKLCNALIECLEIKCYKFMNNYDVSNEAMLKKISKAYELTIKVNSLNNDSLEYINKLDRLKNIINNRVVPINIEKNK